MNSPPTDDVHFVDLIPVIILAAGPVTFAVFGLILRSIHRRGGKVRADMFGFPELLISLALGQIFAAVIVKGVLRFMRGPAPEIKLEQVLPNSFFSVILTVGLIGFLAFRGINVWQALGLDRLSLPRGLLLGAGLVLAVVPGVFLGSVLMQLMLQTSAQKQELVVLFEELARGANRAGAAQIFVAGAIIAPVCEEFLFRGFFYPALKRYVGPVASALLTSALFSAFHLNLASLPGLFLLALCFVIAYEATGSLLVPITMHALFNAGQLAALYFTATGSSPV